jgi:hypothetical protein
LVPGETGGDTLSITLGRKRRQLFAAAYEWGADLFVPAAKLEETELTAVRSALEELGCVEEGFDEERHLLGLTVRELDHYGSLVECLSEAVMALLNQDEKISCRIG